MNMKAFLSSAFRTLSTAIIRQAPILSKKSPSWSWTCKKCISSSLWSCKTCTFLNPTTPMSRYSNYAAYPKFSKVEKISETTSNTLKIMSYNVWFRRLEMRKRMRALGYLIRRHSPDIICFQEVTPDSYNIFKKSSWIKKGLYCSVTSNTAVTRAYFCLQLSKFQMRDFSWSPFPNSKMKRELYITDLEVQKGLPLVVATTHLESPCPLWGQMYSKERIEQAKNALEILSQKRNVIFCGDMNWDDELDGQFPLPTGWVDAWEKLRPKENGWTYDTNSNKMISGNYPLQKRLDRFICNLHDFEMENIEMIGMEAIPGLSYIKEKEVKGQLKELELPVLPSDHYGLILTLRVR